jgi:PKD repeat protein
MLTLFHIFYQFEKFFLFKIKAMNKFYFLFLVVIFFISKSNLSFSQSGGSSDSTKWPTFDMTVKNITFQPGADGQDSLIFWDVYLVQTNYGQPGIDPFEFCCAQYNWYFNKNIWQNPSNGGNLVLTNLGDQTDLPIGLRPPTFRVDSVSYYGTGRGLLQTSGNLPNSSINYFISHTFPGTKILRMKLSTSGRRFNNAPLNLQWRTGLVAPNTFLAYFTPNPPGPDSANPQYAQAILSDSPPKYNYEVEFGYPPYANFIVTGPNTVTAGQVVGFLSVPTGVPSYFYEWNFQGGSPSVSYSPYPDVVYNTPGVYNVSMRVQNPYGSGVLTRYNYITVLPSLPVELNSFSSTVFGNIVTLRWGTVSELNNSGFEVQRKYTGQNDWEFISFVEGRINSNEISSYVYTDRNLTAGSYNYRLKQIDLNGNFEYFNLTETVNIEIPDEFYISQNFPNPFNPSTTFNFNLPVASNLKISLFDLNGKLIKVLENGYKTSGYHEIRINAADLTSGIYYCNFETDENIVTRKMILLK